MTESTDVLIVGGGCSGLSLGHALGQQTDPPKTLIIEPRARYENDRTWSFWAPKEHTLSHLVSQRWQSSLYGRIGLKTQRLDHRRTPYQTIEAISFYQWAMDSIAASHKVTLSLDEAMLSIEKIQGKWVIKTSKRTVIASSVIDTRPPSAEQMATATLYQCFIGEYITTPEPLDDSTVELMTDMRADEHGFLFNYILPLTPHLALVEVTRFSRSALNWSVLEADMKALKAHRGWQQASIHRTERSRLPMGMTPSLSTDPTYVFAGTPGGALRAASGYGFWRIQRWAWLCAEALVLQGHPISHPAEPVIQKWMDQLFLLVLTHEPQRAPELFDALYTRLRPDRLIRFLSDESDLVDKLAVVGALPPAPFLRTLTKLWFGK